MSGSAWSHISDTQLVEVWALSLSLFFFHGKLILSIAMSTTDRQASHLAAFLQAEDRPVCSKASTAHNQVCLELAIMVISSLAVASGFLLRLPSDGLESSHNVAKESQSSICYHT